MVAGPFASESSLLSRIILSTKAIRVVLRSSGAFCFLNFFIEQAILLLIVHTGNLFYRLMPIV
jgi:hypothetical protein